MTITIVCPSCNQNNRWTNNDYKQGVLFRCASCSSRVQQIYCPHCSASNCWKNPVSSVEGRRITCVACSKSFQFVCCPYCNEVNMWSTAAYEAAQVYNCVHCTRPFQQVSCAYCFESNTYATATSIQGKQLKCRSCAKSHQYIRCPNCHKGQVWKNCDYTAGGIVSCSLCKERFAHMLCSHCQKSNFWIKPQTSTLSYACFQCKKDMRLPVDRADSSHVQSNKNDMGAEDSKNNATDTYLYSIRYNNAALQHIAIATTNSLDLNKCATILNDRIAQINNTAVSDKNYDCVAIAVTNDNRLIVSANVKERGLPTKNGVTPYKALGLREAHVKEIKDVIQTEINKYGDFQVDIIQQKPRQNEKPSIYTNARDHAEMQALSYANEQGLVVKSIGTSKDPCGPCEKGLEKHQVDFQSTGNGNQNPKNWEDPEKITTQTLDVTPRNDVRVKCNLKDHTIPKTQTQASTILKNDFKQQLIPKPGCHLTAGTLLDTIDRIDQGGSTYAGVGNTYSGTYESKRTCRMGAYVGASLAEARADYSVFGASASAYSASAHAEVGLNNSIGVNASLVRAEAHAGPVQIGTGLSLNTSASIGLDGIQASALGFGFRVGPKLSVQTPVLDASCNVM